MTRPPLWAAALVTAAVLACAALAVWQGQRGTAKQALLDQMAAAAQAPAHTLMRGDKGGPVPQRVQARGRYDTAHQLLLDGQSHNRRPGYHVWTPLTLDDGGTVLVNRGWVPADADRRVLPEISVPSSKITVRGLWRELPQPGLRLDGVRNCPEAKTFPAVVSYPVRSELHCLLDRAVAAGVLLLDADQPFGFERDWPSAYVGLPPTRHYGYAAQWAVLGLTLLVLFIRSYRKPL